MSSSGESGTQRFMNELRMYLSRHCVSLSYSAIDKPSPKEWKYATGFLMNIDGKRIVATAGHWAAEAIELKSSGNLGHIQIRYNRLDNGLIAKRIEPTAVASDSIPVASDCDAAFLWLPLETANDIEAQGNHFFLQKDFVQGITRVNHLAILCGYPVQAIGIAETPSYFLPDGRKWVQYARVRIGSLAFQSTLLSLKGKDDAIIPAGFDCDSDLFDFQPFLGTINAQPEVTSAAGMSGGPVLLVEFDPSNEATFFEPRLLGMQSSEWTIQRRNSVEITGLTIVGGKPLREWISTTIN